MRTIIALICACVVVGCTVTRYIPSPPIVETHTVEKIIKDTVIEVRLEKDSTAAVVHIDSVSVLETKYAESRAEIIDGRLYHDLKNKDIPIEVETEYVETTIRDTIKVPYPVEVDKSTPFNAFKNILMWCGVVGIVVIIIQLIYIIRKWMQ